MRTTKGGPHGQVQRARNFISESGRPCIFHAARKRHDAIPIDNHAIYGTIRGHAARHGARARGGKKEEKKKNNARISHIAHAVNSETSRLRGERPTGEKTGTARVPD
jgi:hypothetical protein